ncbi:MAG: hypothetical protein ACOZF0_17165 [Thermodesulfobacteriota bacterium]
MNRTRYPENIILTVFVFLLGCGIGIEAGARHAETSGPGSLIEDLAAAPEGIELNGIGIRIEAEWQQAFEPAAFLVRIKTDGILPAGSPLSYRPEANLLCGDEVIDVKLVRPFSSDRRGSALVAAVMSQPAAVVPKPSDFVIRMTDGDGRIRYLRAGRERLRHRQPEIYIAYAGGSFQGDIAAPPTLVSHGLIPIQHDYSGLSSCIAAVLTHQYAEKAGELTVINGVAAACDMAMVMERLAISLFDIKNYLKSIGYLGTGYEEAGPVSLSTFAEDGIDTMAPVIMSVDYQDFRHFVLLRGYDRERVYIGDPALGNVAMTFEELSSVMVRTDNRHWFFFVVRKNSD